MGAPIQVKVSVIVNIRPLSYKTVGLRLANFDFHAIAQSVLTSSSCANVEELFTDH